MQAVKIEQKLKWDGLWRKPTSHSIQSKSRGGREKNGAEITVDLSVHLTVVTG